MATSIRSTPKGKLRKNNQKGLRIIDAVYLRNFEIFILFSNNRMKVVDFAPAIKKYAKVDYAIYAEKKNFKKFLIEGGNIVWGKDWDLIFALDDVYKGNF